MQQSILQHYNKYQATNTTNRSNGEENLQAKLMHNRTANKEEALEEHKLENFNPQISLNQNEQQRFKSFSTSADSDNGSFSSLVLDFLCEETTPKQKGEENESMTSDNNTESTTKENSAHCNNDLTFVNNFKNAPKSVSAENFDEMTTLLTHSNNSGKNQLVSALLKEQLTQVTENLHRKTNECAQLRDENQKLKGSLQNVNPGDQKSLISKFWSYTSTMINENNPDLSNTAEEITVLKRTIAQYEMQLQNKNREIQKYQEKITKQARHLKQAFSKKTEIQREILEEMDEKCRNMEVKLNVERKLREKRETEISHIHNYLDRKESYYEKEIANKEEHIKRIEAYHSQEIQTLNILIKQKDEEISQINGNYVLMLNNCKPESEAINHNLLEHSVEEDSKLKEIKIEHLERSLDLKERHLSESNTKIRKLQEELLIIKRQQLENALIMLEKDKTQEALKKQLENIKIQINGLTDVFQQAHSSRFRHEVSAKQNTSLTFQKKMGNKEEAD